MERTRESKDEYLKKDPNSPLSAKVKKQFKSLNYYPIDEQYRFELDLIPDTSNEKIEMETNTERIALYTRIGYLKFTVDGISCKIAVYQSEDFPDYYFVPFRDKTSGKETYGTGRYLDLEKHNDKFILDFNRAYSPFCAYNTKFSCPLPPMENWLQIPINSGEKNFPHEIY